MQPRQQSVLLLVQIPTSVLLMQDGLISAWVRGCVVVISTSLYRVHRTASEHSLCCVNRMALRAFEVGRNPARQILGLCGFAAWHHAVEALVAN